MNADQCPTDEQLSQFLDGELSDLESSVFDEHLAVCETCQAKLDAITESHLAVDIGTATKDDPAISSLVSKLSVLSPSLMTQDASVTASGIRFPGKPSEDAPLGELGDYKIMEQIGDGSSGLLYRAIDPRIDREVAIKVLRSELASQDESRQRLNREARAVAGLKHPGVVQLYEFGNKPGFPPYLVMELIRGESLGQRVKQGEPYSADDAVSTIVPIARALAAAHDQNLIHRDVKPTNILLDESGQPKITDFGLALLDDGNSELTREGSLAGTPAYISPEQILDPHHVDGRSDIYSLATVMYQMLTGELPFKGVVRMTLLAVLHKDPPPLRQFNDEIPRDIETIILKAMSKDPAKRYQSMAEFADDLERWRDGLPIVARPVGRVERFVRWWKRDPGIATLSAAVACLLLTVTVGSVIASFNLAAARAEAQEAARQARDQRNQAFSTLNRLVYEVNEKFEDDTTDMDEIQQSVLEISVRGLREIAEQTDNATDVSTAAAHLRLGMVLTRLERFAEARDNFDRGDALLAELGGTSSTWQVVNHKIESDWFRAELAQSEENFGKATELMSHAVELAREAHEKWPDDSEIYFTFAVTQSRLADYSYRAGLDETEQLALVSLATWEELEKQDSDDSRVHNETTNMIDTLANEYYDTDEFDKSLRYYERLIRRCEEVLSGDPAASDYPEWLILGNHVMSDIYQVQGNKPKALEHLVAAMEGVDRYDHWLLEQTVQAIQRDLDELRDQMKGDKTPPPEAP